MSFTLNPFYRPAVRYFDDPPAGDPPAGDPPAGDPPAKKPTLFTQDQLGAAVAAERKKLQTQNQQLVAQLEELKSNAGITSEQKDALENQIQQLQATYQTEQQRAAQKAKQAEDAYNAKLKDAEERAKRWEARYAKAEIERAITDAATSERAKRPALVAAVLNPMTKLAETLDAEGKPTGEFAPRVSFPDTDPKTQASVVNDLSVSDAVKRMRELDTLYGALFESDVVGGAGGTAPARSGSSGHMSQEQLIKLAKTNPKEYHRRRKELQTQ